MKLFADECCDVALIDALESMRGATDVQVLERAFSEGRVVVTEDKDFGELVYKLRRPAHGIILLRFEAYDREMKASRLVDALRSRSLQIPGNFIVLDKDKIRVRPLL